MLPLLVVHRYLLYPHLVKLQVSHYMHTLLCWHTCIPRYHPNSYAVLLLHVTLPNPSQNWRQALLVATILDSAIRPASCCHSFTTMVVSIYHGKEHIWSWHHCNHSQLSLHPAYTHFFTPQFNASPNHTSSPPPPPLLSPCITHSLWCTLTLPQLLFSSIPSPNVGAHFCQHP